MERNFGDIIKTYREMKGASLREIAAKAEISPSQLSKLERGLSIPSSKTVIKLAYALNVDKDELLIFAGYMDENFNDSVVDVVTTGFDYPVYNEMFSKIKANYGSATGLRDNLTEVVNIDLLERDAVPDDVDVDFIVREMIAAYELALLRIRNKRM